MNQYFDQVAQSWDANPVKIARARATAEQVRKVVTEPLASLVDFGCGTGLLGVQLRDCFTEVHLADASEEMLRVAREKLMQAEMTNVLTHQVQSLTELPDRYSAITMLMVLHHILDVDTFLAEAQQKLQPDGLLMIADLYAEDGSFHRHNPDFDGHNGFDPERLSAQMVAGGFHVQRIEPYFEMRQTNDAGQETVYPLFFLVARKV